MNIFRFAFLWILLVTVLTTGCSRLKLADSGDLLQDVKQRGSLIVGVKFDSPPFGFMDTDGQLKGFDVALAHELAKEILGDSKAVHFVQVNTSTRVAALNAKQVDFVIATMTITPEREKVVNFSKPYYTAAQGLMVKETRSFKDLKDLQDKTIIFVIGSTTEANLKKALPKAKLLGLKSSTEAFSAFNAGRADAFSQDDTILYGFLHEYCGVRLLSERISHEPYGIAFRKDPISKSLQDKVQAVLDDLSNQGTLKKMSDEWNQPSPPQNCPKG
jgi:aspartate/glutamate/glutamine transport system substrate-binding protein